MYLGVSLGGVKTGPKWGPNFGPFLTGCEKRRGAHAGGNSGAHFWGVFGLERVGVVRSTCIGLPY